MLYQLFEIFRAHFDRVTFYHIREIHNHIEIVKRGTASNFKWTLGGRTGVQLPRNTGCDCFAA